MTFGVESNPFSTGFTFPMIDSNEVQGLFRKEILQLTDKRYIPFEENKLLCSESILKLGNFEEIKVYFLQSRPAEIKKVVNEIGKLIEFLRDNINGFEKL